VFFVSSSSVDSTTSFLLIICMNRIIMYVCVVHLHYAKVIVERPDIELLTRVLLKLAS
jgi:hypothetical protein